MRAAWVTDLHLEQCDPEPRDAFLAALRTAAADCVLIGGDTGHAACAREWLDRVAAAAGRPVYFVLGNHDYYGDSIEAVRERFGHDSGWLNRAGVVRLSEETGLVGHDGWSDGRLGDWDDSTVELNDYFVIEEFKNLDKAGRLALLNELGDDAAAHFRRVLPEALAAHRSVVALTHVPPFREACRYNDAPGHPHWVPHFTSGAVGEAMVEVMQARPDRELLVLCGHTHAPADCAILPNLRVLCGGARYGAPAIQRVFEWS